MTATITATQRIARWASGLTLDAVPPEVRAVARACLIDTLGVALAGAQTDAADHARAVALMTGREGPCSVLGSEHGLTAAAAAAANGAAAHALDFDNTCYGGLVHGSAVILPAALAVAEMVDASGADLLTAFIAGSEAEYAIGAAASTALDERGWWTTGLLGPIGASVAAARLLQLDASATASALGIAIAGTGGMKACFGTGAKPLLAGRAAEAGVVAALLAGHGAGGPRDVMEHPRGFARLFNGAAFEAPMFDALGAKWRMLDPGIDVKRIPVSLSAHAAVDAVTALIAEHGIALADIGRILCDVPPVVAANLPYNRPRNRHEAQFSMPFAIAVSLVFGDLRVEHLDDAVLADPRVAQMMATVEMRTGTVWVNPLARQRAPEGAYIRLQRTGGKPLDAYRSHARGTSTLPLSAAEIDAKFRGCLAGVLDADAADALLGRLHGVESLDSARDVLQSPRQKLKHDAPPPPLQEIRVKRAAP